MELSRKIHPWESAAPRNRALSLALVVALHAIALFALLNYQPLRTALSETAPIMVSLITPIVEKPLEPPKPLPVKPRVQQPKPPEPQELIVATTEIPAPMLAPTPPPPLPAPVVAAPVVAQPIVAAPPPPAPVIPPNFNADYLDNPPPLYPAVSRRTGEQGRVILRVLVNVRGAPDKVELKSSSGSSRLDDAAIDTVKRWRFVPARQGAEPVAAWVLIPITFSLKG